MYMYYKWVRIALRDHFNELISLEAMVFLKQCLIRFVTSCVSIWDM